MWLATQEHREMLRSRTSGGWGLLTKEKCSDDKKRKNVHIKTEKSALSILTDVSHMLIFKGKTSDIWETLF